MTRETYSAEEVDAAVTALSDPDRFGHAQAIVTHAAPSLQRVLSAALEQGGWFDQSRDKALRETLAGNDPVEIERQVATLLAEETRIGMMVGVALGWELARELDA